MWLAWINACVSIKVAWIGPSSNGGSLLPTTTTSARNTTITFAAGTIPTYIATGAGSWSH